MRGYGLIASLALLTLGSCVSNSSHPGAPSTVVNSTTSLGLPLAPYEASLLFTSTRLSPEIVRLLLTSTQTFQGTPVSVKILPPATPTPSSQSVKGGNARLPPLEEIAFTPPNMRPFTGSVTQSNQPRSGGSLIPRQACDPGEYCCPDPRRSFNSTQYPWVTIGRTQTADPNGGFMECAGTMIGRRLVLTASHCINCKSAMLTLGQSKRLSHPLPREPFAKTNACKLQGLKTRRASHRPSRSSPTTGRASQTYQSITALTSVTVQAPKEEIPHLRKASAQTLWLWCLMFPTTSTPIISAISRTLLTGTVCRRG